MAGYRCAARKKPPNDEELATGAKPLLRLREDTLDHFEMLAGRGGVKRFHAQISRVQSKTTNPIANATAQPVNGGNPRAAMA